MAAIDKTYINKEDYIEVRNWWCKTYDKQIEDLKYPLSMSPTYVYDEKKITPKFLKKNKDDILSFKNDDEYKVLWSTSILEDIWLRFNCPVQIIQDTLNEQYNFGKDEWDEDYFKQYENVPFEEIKLNKLL